MTQLIVQDFSCIKSATIDLKPITIIVGPQSSGKSLLARLEYFFVDSILNIFGSTSDFGSGYRNCAKNIEEEFAKSFPVQAWGSKKFFIRFESGPLVLEVSRRTRGSGLQNRAKVEFSDFLKREISRRGSQLRRIMAKSNQQDGYDRSFYDPEVWDLRTRVMRSLIDGLKEDFVESHFFVPAGRSFYSSLGKAVAMLEHGSNLDEVTKRFGRRFTGMLDRRPLFFHRERESAKFRAIAKSHEKSIENLLGGKIKLGGNEKHLETRDGRIIPLSLMSSGQQELLPLLLSMQEHFERNFSDSDPSVDILYIEEPEAHLFPQSQSELVMFIVLMNNQIKRSRMFITTHSPYVLTTLNNCLLAGALGREEDKADETEKIVSKELWLSEDDVSAYAIIDGKVRSIIDKNGIINGDYLDAVSFDISEQFERLIDIEVTSGGN